MREEFWKRCKKLQAQSEKPNAPLPLDLPLQLLGKSVCDQYFNIALKLGLVASTYKEFLEQCGYQGKIEIVLNQG